MSAAALRKGWCPGALRPMRTGDGLLVRLRITGGVVPAALARDIAEAARRFGNGMIDLSARANLQLRGVSDTTLEPLTLRLAALGLLDDDPDAEAVRNIMASPLAGRDPTALLDIRPVIRALEDRLRTDRALHALPGKFGFLIDDGGQPGLGGEAADIRFEAFDSVQGVRFAVRAGGTALSAHPITTCDPAKAADVAAALAKAFLTLRGDPDTGHRRMATLVDAIGPQRLAGSAGLAWADAVPGPVPTGPVLLLGAWMAGELPVLGVAAPFGAWTADGLDRLADMAEQSGCGELRLTPWRAILLPGVADPEAAARLAPDLVTDPGNPRLAVAACTGAPGCSSASVPTRRDALELAALLPDTEPAGITLHVSGCAKGCAHPASASLVLVGRDGFYDMIRNGRAGDTPVLTGLTVAKAAAFIDGSAWDSHLRKALP